MENKRLSAVIFRLLPVLIKLALIWILFLGMDCAGTILINIFSETSIELPKFTTLSLYMIQNYILAGFVVVGSLSIIINEAKTAEDSARDSITEIIWLLLLLIHIAVFFSIIMPMFNFV